MKEKSEIRQSVVRCVDAREVAKEFEALGYAVRFEAHGRWDSMNGLEWDFVGIPIVVPDTGSHIVIDDIFFRRMDKATIEVIATPIEVTE